jgi:hypothetical protein
MDRDRADLIDQLNGLIFLARVSWRLSPGRLAHMARTLRFVGEMDQAAAHATRAGQPMQLRIKYEDIL